MSINMFFLCILVLMGSALVGKKNKLLLDFSYWGTLLFLAKVLLDTLMHF